MSLRLSSSSSSSSSSISSLFPNLPSPRLPPPTCCCLPPLNPRLLALPVSPSPSTSMPLSLLPPIHASPFPRASYHDHRYYYNGDGDDDYEDPDCGLPISPLDDSDPVFPPPLILPDQGFLMLLAVLSPLSELFSAMFSYRGFHHFPPSLNFSLFLRPFLWSSRWISGLL
ncbi:hypothetical protein MLD38_002808 [Melastoma candidum]|uniref:Uncharacterized protein n=1 Tax=Melastoma candidum TaxID=119954 RepID=A0ACB9S0N7_9MYRT|nr:hypothetical protein MLD38_002808 [Melastoma candidum]